MTSSSIRFAKGAAALIPLLLVMAACGSAPGTGDTGNDVGASDTGTVAEPVTGGCVQNGGAAPPGDYSSCDYQVNPRVNGGGFNGHVHWENDLEGSYALGVYGEVWDNCGGTAHVYLSWAQNCFLNWCPVRGNDDAGHASNHKTAGVNYYVPQMSPFGGVSDVIVTVCSTCGGWHCGAGQHV
jgi:hypothetical protein